MLLGLHQRAEHLGELVPGLERVPQISVHPHRIHVVTPLLGAQHVPRVDQVLHDAVPTRRAISANRISASCAMHTSTCAWLVRNVHDGTRAGEGASDLATTTSYVAPPPGTVTN